MLRGAVGCAVLCFARLPHLQICSHFSLGRSSTGVASAGNVVATILKGKRERKEQLDSKVQKLQQQLSRVNDRIKVPMRRLG